MRVLLTGINGFIGSHIAEGLLSNHIDVIGVIRQTSSLVNCLSFKERVKFIIIDDKKEWISRLIEYSPDIIIHAAWTGVMSVQRDDWNLQLSNIDFVTTLLYIAEQSKTKKIISLGSQAEYGTISELVTETTPLNPENNYGYLKTVVCKQVESFCELYDISWFWLRIFSVYGERESGNWLLPSLIIKLIKGEEEMNFTPAEQKYAYLYVKDLSNAIVKVCQKENAKSGIYNLSASQPNRLKDLLSQIKDRINSDFRLNYGVLSYRKGQSMLIQGDSTKFIKEFGTFECTSFTEGIENTINYYKKANESI